MAKRRRSLGLLSAGRSSVEKPLNSSGPDNEEIRADTSGAPVMSKKNGDLLTWWRRPQ